MSIPSPLSTGGAGEKFELHVGAYALGLLLVRGNPPILTDTVVSEVHFQVKVSGWHTDDILIVGERSDGSLRQLALQVTRNLSISAKNKKCRETFVAMWDDFCADERFDRSADQLAVVVLNGTATLLRHFNAVLVCARSSVDAEDFDRRLLAEGFISKRAKEQNSAIVTILEGYFGKGLDADLYWRFLRAINVVSLDLNTPTAETKAGMLTLLSRLVTDIATPEASARDTWARLIECASRGIANAQAFGREELPQELLEKYSTISVADGRALKALMDHGKTVRANIRSTIGNFYTVDRSSISLSLVGLLAEHQVVIVSGTAGSGKSALAKDTLNDMESKCPILAFQAVEFATGHLDETLANAQSTLNGTGLIGLLAGYDRKIILIESVERLLEHSARDAFSHLLNLAVSDRSVQLLLTVRDYSLETVRNAFLVPAGLSPLVYDVPPFSSDELDELQAEVPSLRLPLRDSQLRSFLRTPYLLDMASRLKWSDTSYPASAREFRQKCWHELIRADKFTRDGMPDRREKAFLDVAYRRAIELRPFVNPGTSDNGALAALIADSIVVRDSESSSLFAAAHDVLEDWGILRWLDVQFAMIGDSPSELSETIGGYPAIRRGFRRWLGERFESRADEARNLVLRIVANEDLPAHFRDDCIVAVLLSDSAPAFIENCLGEIVDGDGNLIDQLIHMLRVGCKESPRWTEIQGLPSQMLVPIGKGWAPLLGLASSLPEEYLQKRWQILLGLVEDWARQIDFRNTEPEGFVEAGKIVGALLPVFDDYGFDDARKRLLKVLAKIPRAVPQFGDLMELAKAGHNNNRTVGDFTKIMLNGFECGYVCADYPEEIFSLLNSLVRITESNLDSEVRSSHSDVVNANFGIVKDWTLDVFPASGHQGPFFMLLQKHPAKSVEFILDLLNHAGDWYGNRRWPGRHLEWAWKIKLVVPGIGEREQWMNGRLFALYRGMTVGPYLLQSALMALESWLLSIAKVDEVDLESWLLYILRNSNNVMATGVVASVCVAHPVRGGRAGLALLSCREIVQCDRNRFALERGAYVGGGHSVNPIDRFHEKERKLSKELPHRGEDLERLAVRLQLSDMREDVWTILDDHWKAAPVADDEEKKIWRLALHRMDVRKYEAQAAPKESSSEPGDDASDKTWYGPGNIEPEIQEMVDKNIESQIILDRHLRLQNRARDCWKNRDVPDSENWRAYLLSEAMAIDRELEEPEEYCRAGPGFVAALCVRDHPDELDDDEFRWCVTRIEHEVLRDAESRDLTIRHGRGAIRPDRACASMVAVLATNVRAQDIVDTTTLLSNALTHAVDEVVEFTCEGAGVFLGDEHKDIVLLCAAAAAYRARLIAELREKQRKLPIDEQVYGWELTDSVLDDVRTAIRSEKLDTETEIKSLDLDDADSDLAIRRMLRILGHHPSWRESRDFFSRVASWIASCWDVDYSRTSAREVRNIGLEYVALPAIARFVLKLSAGDARKITSPIMDWMTRKPSEFVVYLRQLIMVADENVSDCFWDLWADIAKKLLDTPWQSRFERSRPSAVSLVNLVFLGIHWKEDVKHWHRLDGHAQRLDDLARHLPSETSCILAYTRFLSTIGQESLPESFKTVNFLIQRGDGKHIASDSSIAFDLETLLQRYVYSEPQRVKSNDEMRVAIMSLLNALVTGGSSSAYRMRDDFVTPIV